MKFSWCIFFIVGITMCAAKVYEPCDLAVELYRLIESQKWNSLVTKIPLLVCVAGYHEYNSRKSFKIFSSDNYNGIFGLPEDPRISQEGNREFSRNPWGWSFPDEGTFQWHNLTLEVDIFAHEVLKIDRHFSGFYVQTTYGHPNVRFFNHICSGSYVRNETCRFALNPYIVSAFEIPIPTDKGLLNRLRSRHDKLDSFDPFAFRIDFSGPASLKIENWPTGLGVTPTIQATGESWYWQAVGVIITFWIAGVIPVGVAVFGYYHYILRPGKIHSTPHQPVEVQSIPHI